jgi:DNA-binding SARP family transcriptional activator
MRVSPGQLDLDLFRHIARRSQQAEAQHDIPEALSSLRQALALWRGPVAATVDSLAITAMAARLNEERLALQERRIELELKFGMYRNVIGELVELVNANPLHEGLRGKLMLAMYGDGRQADALDAYRTGFQILSEELGIDPIPELQKIHELILSGSLSAPEIAELAGQC